MPHRTRIFGDVHLPVQQRKPLSNLQTRLTNPSSLSDIINKNYRQRSASPKNTTTSLDSYFGNYKNLSDHPSVKFEAEMVKATKTTTQQSQQTSTSIQLEQPRQMSQSTGQKKRKLGSKLKAVDIAQKPLINAGVKANAGHENRLETISIQSSTLPRPAPGTLRENSSNSVKEDAETKPSSKSTARQKTKKEGKSSVDVLRKQEQKCEKCGFVKIINVVDRCTDTGDANRLSLSSEANEVNSSAEEVILSSETVGLDVKTEATQTGSSSHSGLETELSQMKARNQGCPSECPAFQDECCETCGRPLQPSEDELRYRNEDFLKARSEEPNMTQRELSERTNQRYSSQEEPMFRQCDYQDDKAKPRYYETESSGQATQCSIDCLGRSSKPPQCGPCGRFNDEKCKFDCSARRPSADKPCVSCGRPNDRRMSAPLVSFKSSRMFDSAALPYQRTAKSLDFENYGRPTRDPMDDFQKEFMAQPNESNRRRDYPYFEENCDEYQPMERKIEKPPQTKRLSQSPAKPKCHRDTCTKNCRCCSRRNTDRKPTYQGSAMTAQQIRCKSKSPHIERPRYPPRSVFSVDNDRSAEYLAMHQYRQGVNEEIARSNAARSPFNTNMRNLLTPPTRSFDRCCLSTQTSRTNEQLSQSQRRMSAPLQNTPRSTSTFRRSGSVDSINNDVERRPVEFEPDLSNVPDGPSINAAYDQTRMANQKNNCHPPKDCKCCCCCQRRLEEESRVSEMTANRTLDGEIDRRRSIPLEARLSQIQNHAAVLANTSRSRFGSSDPGSECNCPH